MKLLLAALLLTSFLLAAAALDSPAPFFWGYTTPSWCLGESNVVRQPKVPYVCPFDFLHHSWLFFRGGYFEFIGDSHGGRVFVNETAPFASQRCRHGIHMEGGNSSLGLSCLMKCAKHYEQEYGGYNLLTNNCHYYVQRMMLILASNKCPDWCG